MEDNAAEALASLLRKLADETTQRVGAYRDAGELVLRPVAYQKWRVTDLSYNESGLGYTLGAVEVSVDEWDLSNRFDFIDKQVRTIPEYPQCAAVVSAKRSVGVDEAEKWLLQFVHTVLDQAAGVRQEPPRDAISAFVADVCEMQIEWNAEVWVEGIWLEDQRYEVEQGFTLRRPTLSDLEVQRPHELFLVEEMAGQHRVTQAVIELRYRGTDRELSGEIEFVIDVLRLFRLGSVYIARVDAAPLSIIRRGFWSRSPEASSAKLKYRFTAADVPLLSRLMEQLRRVARAKRASLASDLESLEIARHRFADALAEAGVIDSITGAVMGLEAIYSKGGERTDISRRLGQRVSALLRLVGFSPLEVADAVRRAYHVRSTFLHGSREKGDEDVLRQLSRTSLEFLRVSLLVFSQLIPPHGKDDVLTLLDNSLLEARSARSVAKMVAPTTVTGVYPR